MRPLYCKHYFNIFFISDHLSSGYDVARTELVRYQKNEAYTMYTKLHISQGEGISLIPQSLLSAKILHTLFSSDAATTMKSFDGYFKVMRLDHLTCNDILRRS